MRGRRTNRPGCTQNFRRAWCGECVTLRCCQANGLSGCHGNCPGVIAGQGVAKTCCVHQEPRGKRRRLACAQGCQEQEEADEMDLTCLHKSECNARKAAGLVYGIGRLF